MGQQSHRWETPVLFYEERACLHPQKALSFSLLLPVDGVE